MSELLFDPKLVIDATSKAYEDGLAVGIKEGLLRARKFILKVKENPRFTHALVLTLLDGMLEKEINNKS